MLIRIFLTMILALSVTGCVSTGKGAKDMQIQQLQGEASRLKNELQSKDEEINALEWQLKNAKNQKSAYTTREKAGVKSAHDTVKMTPKNIQLALKKTGFYNGPVDGNIGDKTRKAIKEFQKENGLVQDGVVGKQTWLKLKSYYLD